MTLVKIGKFVLNNSMSEIIVQTVDSVLQDIALDLTPKFVVPDKIRVLATSVKFASQDDLLMVYMRDGSTWSPMTILQSFILRGGPSGQPLQWSGDITGFTTDCVTGISQYGDSMDPSQQNLTSGAIDRTAAGNPTFTGIKIKPSQAQNFQSGSISIYGEI